TATIGGGLPDSRLKSDQVVPRLSVTRHWSPELMSYASVARGYRGGGFNAPAAPNRVYGGDFAWTYELGSRYASADLRLTLSGAIFYNDYRHYIGLNSVAPLAPTGFVTVDLNSGTVDSYGVELEATVRPLSRWRIAAGATLIHARLTDSREYSAVTRRSLASDRLPFQPDWTFNLHSDYAIPVGSDELIFGTGIAGKGRRLAATLNPTTATFLNPYYLVDASITYRRGIAEFSLFANNLFNERYFDSYIEKTTLQLANIPPSDVGIVGDRRRIGVRTSLIF
ncbi:MAG: TonB-dependent receptor, partial [Sphingobium sp.]